MPRAPLEICVAIMALGFTSMMFGLMISALVKTAEKTMPLLVMFAIVQVVFTGVLFQLYGSPGLEQFAWLMPSRWAVAGAGTTLDLAHACRPGTDDPTDSTRCGSTRPRRGASTWPCCSCSASFCGFVVARLLRRHEPEVMRK